MKRRFLAIATLAVLLCPGAADAQTVTSDVAVTVDLERQSVTLGDHIDISVTVTNTGTQALSDLIAHIDITDPGKSSSVDPEDWTATLSKPVGALAPGQSVAVPWRIQPISPGTFTVYAVTLASDSETIAASNAVHVLVDDQRSLNPNGILPVAIAAPTLIGGLFLLQLRANRHAYHPKVHLKAGLEREPQ